MAFTTGQAGGQLQQLSTLPAEYSGDAQELARAQRLAQMLSSAPTPEGQMISGRYVAPSITQNLAQLAQAGLGAYYGSQAEDKELKLANKLRQDRMMTQEGIMNAINKGDTKTALAIASSRPEFGKEFIAPLMQNVIPKAGESKVVGNTLVGPDGKPIYTAPKEFAPHAPQLVQTSNGMVSYNPNTQQATPAMMNGQPLMPPLDSGAKNDLRDINRQQTVVQGALQAVKDNPTAFGFKRGAAGSLLPQGEAISAKFEKPEETEARSYVFNIVSKVIHDRAGASQTPSEIAKINRFLPSEYDGPKEIERKLKGFQNFLADEAKGIKTPFNPQANPPPPAANNQNRKIEKEGTVQDGPNKGKRAIQYSDGTIEYR